MWLATDHVLGAPYGVCSGQSPRRKSLTWIGLKVTGPTGREDTAMSECVFGFSGKEAAQCARICTPRTVEPSGKAKLPHHAVPESLRPDLRCLFPGPRSVMSRGTGNRSQRCAYQLSPMGAVAERREMKA
jgi:hypothetical protein